MFGRGRRIENKLDAILVLLWRIVMTNEELATQLTTLNGTVDKIKTEILALQALVASLNDVPQVVVDAVNTLAANLQSADDLNPDEVPPSP